MSYTFMMPCPVTLEETGDSCGEEIEVEMTKEERATYWYPGSPAEFEVVFDTCGHKGKIEMDHIDDVFEYTRDMEIAAMEAMADAQREDRIYRRLYEKEEFEAYV